MSVTFPTPSRIVDDLTYVQGEGERIHATMKITDDEDARALGGRIVALYHRFHRKLTGSNGAFCWPFTNDISRGFPVRLVPKLE
jgi:hypothetical protein